MMRKSPVSFSRLSTTTLLGAVALLGVPTGCPEPEPTDGGTFVGEDAGELEEDAGPALPPERPAECPTTSPFVYQLKGQVLLEDGTPPVGAKAQTCVRTYTQQFLCLQPSDVQSDGTFVIDIPATARCMELATSRVLVPLADSATVYCPIALEGAEGVVEIGAPYVMVATERPAAIPPVGDDTVARDV